MTSHLAMADLVEVYALDSLVGRDQVEFESHLATCGQCDARLVQAEGVLASLVADAAAPWEVWDRIEARLDFERGARARSPRRASTRPLMAIAAAVIVMLGGVLLTQRSETSDQALAAAAARAAGEPGASLSVFEAGGVPVAEVVLTDEGVGYILPTDDLQTLEESRTYQLWVVNHAGRVISGGVLGNDPSVSTFTWTDGISGLILTRERAGGVETSEGDVVSRITDL